MTDDEMCNFCADLVSLQKTEAFPLYLFQSKLPGEWGSIHDLCLQLGVPSGDLEPSVFATWLPDPMGNSDFAEILFYDSESMWSMVAHYNRTRLLAGVTTSQPLGTGQPASQDSSLVEATPLVGM